MYRSVVRSALRSARAARVPRVPTAVSTQQHAFGTTRKTLSGDPDGGAEDPAPEAAIDVAFQEVMSAHLRIRPGVQPTRLYRSAPMSKALKCNIYFKCEQMHPTGSFKERGARNALMRLKPELKKAGVVAASAGNHALGLAFHGADLGIPCTVVMPKIAPLMKQHRCRDIGAEVILHGDYLINAREYALDLAAKTSRRYINGYDDPDVIAGAGTVGLEILQDLPTVDAIVVPVGGGGLIAGIALAVKTLRPEVQIIGAEPGHLPSLGAALKAGHPVSVEAKYTLADGLNVTTVGTNAFETIRNRIDRLVNVDEQSIALAMLRIVESEKLIVEGAGATGLAALLQSDLADLEGKNVVVPLCGGNVDVPLLGRVLERGLAADQRLVHFQVDVIDRPGGIASVVVALKEANVSIKEIVHDRSNTRAFDTVSIRIVVETQGAEHTHSMFEMLRNRGFHFAIVEGTSISR